MFEMFSSHTYMLPCGGRIKSPYIIIGQNIFISFGIIEPTLSFQKSNTTYVASQITVLHRKRLNQTVSDFRDFVCSFFPKAMLLYFY